MTLPSFLKYSRGLGMTAEEYLHMILDYRNKDGIAEILQYIYTDRRNHQPQKKAMAIMAELQEEFGMSRSTMKRHLYLELEEPK